MSTLSRDLATTTTRTATSGARPRSCPAGAALVALLGVACGGASEAGAPAPSPAPAPSATAEAATPAPPITAPPAKPSAKERAREAFKADEARAQAEAFREHLALGRKEVKAKRYAEGIAAFEAALKIDPNSPSALAELGWAAFLASDLDRAEQMTRRAIDSSAASDRTRGAALYNLGRVHEERGDGSAAITDYTRSLRLRPNKTVSERLSALVSAGAQAPSEEAECAIIRHEGPAPADLCAPMVAAFTPDDEYSGLECDLRDYEPTGERRHRVRAQADGGIAVVTFGVTRLLESGGAIGTTYIAVTYPDRWYLGELGSEYNPGVGYIGESFTVDEVSAEDLIPGGRPEVVIRATWEHHDGDYGDNAMESGRDATLSILSVEGDDPRWLTSLKTSVLVESGPMLDDMESEAPVTSREDRVDVRFISSTDQIEVKAVPGHEPSAPVGTFRIGEGQAACPGALSFIGA